MVFGLFSPSSNINAIDEDYRFSTERHHAKRPAWIWQKRPTDRSVCFWRTTPLSGMSSRCTVRTASPVPRQFRQQQRHAAPARDPGEDESGTDKCCGEQFVHLRWCDCFYNFTFRLVTVSASREGLARECRLLHIYCRMQGKGGRRPRVRKWRWAGSAQRCPARTAIP
jgi:hypothetical protein